MKVILDGLGGERVAEACRQAVPLFLETHPKVLLQLAADRPTFAAVHAASTPALRERLSCLEAAERVEFSDKPVAALKAKPRSSIRLGIESLAKQPHTALVSFGHTGAAVAAACLYLGRAPGVSRPGLAAIVPHRRGHGLLMDVGANLKCSAGHLLDYALMARRYLGAALGIHEPRIGLLNIGEETGKGDRLLNRAHELFRAGCPGFCGNVEGYQIFDGSVDAVITAGLAGNMVLKAAESLAGMIFLRLDEEIAALGSREGADREALRRALEALAARHHPDARGACRLLGVNGVVLIGHGNAGPRAIVSGLQAALRELELGQMLTTGVSPET